MAIDREGNLAVCHVGFGAVWLFSAKGEPMYRIDSPEGLFTTNCAYGGKDGKQLAGAAKTSSMKKCCEASAMSADGKKLSGAAKNSSVKKCMGA